MEAARSMLAAWVLAAPASWQVLSTSVGGATCPGSLELQGYGLQNMTNAYWNVPGELAGNVEVIDGKVVAYMKGRTYFSESCSDGPFDYQKYSAIPLLGKKLRWTTDLAGAGCGCNAALYLTSLRQNADISQCFDYYCDANSVCGVRCAEIDLQEANEHAWHSTLHVAEDGGGVGAGYGGGGDGWNHNRDWTKEQYGPDAACIDTTKPFQAEVAFPVEWTDGEMNLMSMTTLLTQQGRDCSACCQGDSCGSCRLEAEVRVRDYSFRGQNTRKQLTEALQAGMTPIVSYWSSDDMLWMDGKGQDGKGPCERDNAAACGPSVSFYDFSIESLDLHLV